jgi:peptidoglycan-associated lipoprotein
MEGKACAADADCGAGYHCENGICHANCDAANPCGAGSNCVGGRCTVVEEKPIEKACSTSGTIHFDFDKYDIKSGDDSILDDLGMCLNKDASVKIVVEGNCDERGSSEYNMALGNRRADAVKSYLSNKGVSADRVKTVSFGKEQPVDTGHNEEAWAKNRRADVKPQ